MKDHSNDSVRMMCVLCEGAARPGFAPLYFMERHPRIKTQLYCEENILSRLADAQSHLQINEIKQIPVDSFIRG